MKNLGFLTCGSNLESGEIYECETCGNHVCRRCATGKNFICPHCFGRLLHIN